MPVDWVTFDCYGTLIDWERGITDALLPLLPPRTDWRALAEWYIAMGAQSEKEGYHLYHDMQPAAALGFRTIFIDRHGETLETSPTRVLPDLRALPDVIVELAEG